MLYDYKCPNCNYLKENVIHSAFEKPKIKCDKCKSIMKKQFSSSFNIVISHSDSKNISSTKQDILRHQAKVISETQGGL
ncbi:MAG: zinc ribbon domain-containing protein [Candidatus Thorarchaeota archaeon]